MTTPINNNQDSISQSVESEPTLSPHQTQEYKDSIKRFMQASQYYNLRKPISTQDKSKIKSPNISYRPEDINRWLQNPVQNEERLRTLSNYLYNTNALYKWVINTIGLMPKYSWKLTQDTLTNKKSKTQRKNSYYEALTYIDKLNLPHELIKVLLIALKEDWYYGYEMETDDSYFILPLDAKFCKPSSRNLDGTYNFKFNFQYFDDKKDILATYPTEFKRKYNQAKKSKDQWIELDTNRTICLKFNDEFEYAMPYYAILFNSLLNLDYYQEIKKDRAANENFMLLHQHIPIDEKDYNKFAIDPDLASTYHRMAEASLPDGVAVITSPMKVEAVKTETTKSFNDYVQQAYRDFYTNSGIPQHLSNSDNNTSVGLGKAIVVNEQLVFRFYRQIERIINRKLKFKFPTQKFKFRLLDTTAFNQSDFIDMMLKLAQNGIPDKIDLVSASGKSPYEFFNDLELEEGLFDLTEMLKPLKTSHTQSASDSDSKGGAPTKSDDEISDNGMISRDKDSDANKKARS